ncbi:type I restriction endonuclease [Algoriphagus antarcticus]|uniref:type I site-specific deoxyribonuclease n=1 Tax=Algoriphagus antarcticus TaxID=238540 RepID=A0A3E0E1D5_9BACT|nr:type I restriction endonuclease [Algoriphagus antarcticus]REG90716.1 RHS repeat-associated protein [Algoriphagus antarcticus]
MQTPSFQEDHISQIPAIQLLIKLGYDYLSQAEAMKLRGGKTSQVILEEILRKQLKLINSEKRVSSSRHTYLSDANIDSGIRSLQEITLNEGYIHACEKVYNFLALGKAVEQSVDGDKKSFTLQYIDWENLENNHFHVTEEYKVVRSGSKDHYIPDLVLFINGIPIVVIECKRPDMKDPLKQAISQHLRNQQEDGIRGLYVYAQMVLSLATQESSYATNVPHERLAQEVIAEEPGYFYIYLSNESQTGSEAFFNDFSIMTSESYVVQQTDYYPYGMIAKNWTRVGEKATKDLFQGKTYEDLTKWYDFHSRQYDAALGRWFGSDPKAGVMPYNSPYSAMMNNPVMFTDPDGECPICFAAIIGAAIGAAGYTANVTFSNGGFNNWNWAQFGKSVGMGALSGVVTTGIGTMMGPVGSLGLGGEIGRAMMHGQANIMVGAAFGQNPSMGSYLTSFASSFGGSSFMMYGGKFANSTVGLYGFSGMAGGLTANATGGNFSQGFAAGLINAGLNHAKSKIDASGARYFANKKAFYDYLWKNSFDANGNSIRELSGWELENGNAIALPYDKNYIAKDGTYVSFNDALDVVPGEFRTRWVQFKGQKYQINTHAHTHPQSYGLIPPGYKGGPDALMIKFVNNPIKILHNANLFRVGLGSDGAFSYQNMGRWK